MRKTISMLLVIVAATGSVSVHEAAAQARGNGRGESVTHGKGEARRVYDMPRLCIQTSNGSKLYSEDRSGWRWVGSCRTHEIVD